MEFSVCFISLIAICIISKTYAQNGTDSSGKDPGCAGCSFYGATDESCGEIVPAACLPDECESLFFYWIHSDPDTFEIIDYIDDVSNRVYLDDLDSVGKPVFLYYGQWTIDEWITLISCNTKDGGEKAQCEMQSLKTYLDQFENIGGLVLTNLCPDENTTCTPDVTANLKIYIDEMRKTFPDYGIGMEIIGRKLIDYNENFPPCLDFSCIDPLIDFYILDLYYFNDCTPDLEVGGATPISGDKGRTLEQLVAAAEKVGISKSKFHFGYRSGATPIEPSNLCNETNTRMCSRENNDGFCADNTQSYYDKGTFAKNNGIGFVMSNVDVADDPNSLCKCGTPYPAFHDVLAGFKGDAVPPPCPLLDKC